MKLLHLPADSRCSIQVRLPRLLESVGVHSPLLAGRLGDLVAHCLVHHRALFPYFRPRLVPHLRRVRLCGLFLPTHRRFRLLLALDAFAPCGLLDSRGVLDGILGAGIRGGLLFHLRIVDGVVRGGHVLTLRLPRLVHALLDESFHLGAHLSLLLSELPDCVGPLDGLLVAGDDALARKLLHVLLKLLFQLLALQGLSAHLFCLTPIHVPHLCLCHLHSLYGGARWRRLRTSSHDFERLSCFLRNSECSERAGWLLSALGLTL
mmetsp:Transcript_35230/g.92454  ORF Transcript_35230/g.92454 Transcript_35230/m.92454 type:complete len:263 (+) Transcript_35230:468-1256(+)